MTFSFVQRDLNSSVFSAVVATLSSGEYGEWRQLEKESLHFDVMFGDRNRLPFAKIGNEGRNQLVNYYRGSEVICRKVGLNRTLHEHCQIHDIPMFDWYPPSFVIIPRRKQSDIESLSEIQRLKYEASQKRDERHQLKDYAATEKCTWIAKSSNGAKGEGIKISKDVDELLSYIDEEAASHVVQKYIDKPLLLDGQRKFDIRSWVLLDHEYNIYLFKESVLRTASDTYLPDDFSATTSHLTNHCLQEDLSQNYGKYEEGNEMFFDEFDKFLRANHNTSVAETVVPQIKEIVKTCLLTIEEKICTNGIGYHSFQLFGFDFMMDEDLKVWLLEINGAPACAQKLLPQLVRSLIQKAILPVFQSSSTNVSTTEMMDLIYSKKS